MTVGELRRKLEKYPDDHEVWKDCEDYDGIPRVAEVSDVHVGVERVGWALPDGPYDVSVVYIG